MGTVMPVQLLPLYITSNCIQRAGEAVNWQYITHIKWVQFLVVLRMAVIFRFEIIIVINDKGKKITDMS